MKALHIRNGLLNIAGQGVPALATVILLPMIILRLTEAEYAAFASLQIILAYFTFLDFGLSRTATRIAAIRLSKRKKIQGGYAALFFLAAPILGAAIATGLYVYIQKSSMGQMLPSSNTTYAIIFAIVLLSIFQNISIGIMTGSAQYPAATILTIIPQSALYSVILLISIFSSHPEQYFIISILLIRLSTFPLALLQVKKVTEVVDLRDGLEDAKKAVAYTKWIFLDNVLIYSIIYADRAVIGYIISPAAMAAYHLCYQVFEKILLVSKGLSNYLFSIYSARIGDEEIESRAARAGSSRAVHAVALIYIALGMIAILAAENLMSYFDERIAVEYKQTYQMMIAGFVLSSIAQAYYVNCLASGLQAKVTKIHFAELVVYIPAAIILTSQHGALGMAVAFLARHAVDLTALYVLSEHRMGARLRETPEL